MVAPNDELVEKLRSNLSRSRLMVDSSLCLLILLWPQNLLVRLQNV